VSPLIHPTAIIEDGAVIGEGVKIGPYSHIGPNVTIGDNCMIDGHVVIDGHTTLGKDNQISSFTAIGKPPQHARYEGEASTIVIGDRNVFRENFTAHPGTKVGNMTTIIGNDNMFFVGTHVAHDCVVGNNNLMVNYSILGGHVTLEDYVYIGATSGTAPFCRIGRCAMVNAMTAVNRDIIPYGNVFGTKAEMIGLNLVGMKRRDISKDDINIMQEAYKLLFAEEGTFGERREEAEHLYADNAIVNQVLQFIKDGNGRHICQPARKS
jgi:UDP-N-acetylglucosamine acyltransferase